MRQVLGRLYGAAARRRRAWYAARPDARRRLTRPVVSVGGISVGGSGKTPIAAEVARLLVTLGERPAILSRGYARADPVDGVVVVRDHDRVRGDLATAGDEPWMLAGRLDGVAVVVAADRYLAGRLAETRLGSTVHLLDDGFQHLRLERSLDLVVLRPEDLDDAVLPAGRLREGPQAVRAADAVLVVGADEAGGAAVAARLGIATPFGVVMALAPPQAGAGPLQAGTPVFAVAGIARPGRFFDDLRAIGFPPAGTARFPDHHRFTGADVTRIQRRAREAGCAAIVTTEKDAVRLAGRAPLDPPLAVSALSTRITPQDRFQALLADRVAGARAGAA